MKYQRPHVHIYSNNGNSTYEVSVLVPLEHDYDNINVSTNIHGEGVEIFISLGSQTSSNVHVEKIGPEQFTFSSMPSLTVEVFDENGNPLGRFFTEDPGRDADPEATDEVSHYIYLNQPVGGDYELHVLVDIDDSFRNKDTSNGLSNPLDGLYVIEIEEVSQSRNGLPIEGSATFGSAPSTIEIRSEDVSQGRVRGPKKTILYNRDVRP